MTNLLLKDLYRLLSKDYLTHTLKRGFSRKYWNHIGIEYPEDNKLMDNYTLTINDFNPISGHTDQIHYEYNYENFVNEHIKKVFMELKYNYFHEMQFYDDEVKKQAYYKSIYFQLQEFFKRAKSKEETNTYIDQFKSGIQDFKTEFGSPSRQMAVFQNNLAYSFKINLESGIDKEEAKYKLSKIYRKLKAERYISARTEEADFLQLFTGKIIDHRVQWVNTLSSFCFFIKLLVKKPYLEISSSHKWLLAEKCFFILNKDSVEYPSSKYKWQKKPSKEVQDLLNKILEV